jgi:hypothetical protein
MVKLLRLAALALLLLIFSCAHRPRILGAGLMNASDVDYDDTAQPATGQTNVQGALDALKVRDRLTTNGHQAPGGGWMSQPAWFVDPQNSCTCASDSASGADILHPLLTFLELGERWGVGFKISVPTVQVFVLSDGAPSDPFTLDVTLDSNAQVQVFGGPSAALGSGATVLQAGTFSAVAAISHPGNTMTLVTDSAGRPFDGFLSRRLRNPATNAYGWVGRAIAGGIAEASSPSKDGSTYLLPNVVSSSFTPGDSYQIEQLHKVWLGRIHLMTSNGSRGVLAFQDFEVSSSYAGISAGTVAFRGCRFINTAPPGTQNNFAILFSNDSFENQLDCNGPILCMVDAGLFRSTTFFPMFQVTNGIGSVDGDALFEGGYIASRGGVLLVGVAGVFHVGATVGGNPRGSAVVVGGTGNIFAGPGGTARFQTINHGPSAVYGSDNAGYGVDVFPEHRASANQGSLLTATGRGGDFILGSDATSIVYATKATVSSPPSYSAALAPTWSNFYAAQPAGFGGDAHNVASDSHLLLN